ncbi:MAG: hypothetical protein AB7D19_07670 [Acetobacter sp.]|uniref:hypothetical protein n=1 Tax=Acetobacter sp. TaxID=440 RepID=UPI003D04D181
MKVFLSWSGEQSKHVAELLKDWLPRVIQSLKPWVSTQDIQKGSLWSEIIGGELQETTAGIICLTMENKERPWILFEAGALAKGLTTSRVCTFLIDLKPTDITPPLSQFNHTNASIKEDILQLLRTLNDRLEDSKLAPSILENSLEVHWPQFNAKLKEIKQSLPHQKINKREEYDILLEILENTRDFPKKLSLLISQEQQKTNNENNNYLMEAKRKAQNISNFIAATTGERNQSEELRKYIANIIAETNNKI